MVSENDRTYIYPGHVDTVSSDQQTFTQMDFNEFKVNTDGGMNYTTFRQGGINYNNIYFNLNSNKTSLENYTIATLDDIPNLTDYVTSNQLFNALSPINSNITDLQTLTSTHTSQISALQTSVSNCVTLSQLSTTLSDYALKSEIPSYSLSTTSTPVLSSATLSQSYETLTFTYADDTTASFNFLTTGTTLSTSTVNVLDSTTLS